MKKIIIAPDSFKGTLSSRQVVQIIEEKIKTKHPDWEIVPMPIADGGEGSLEAILESVGGKKRKATVKSPAFHDIEAEYGITKDGIGILELSRTSGLNIERVKLPMTATTYGFGQLILKALDEGIRDFILCLGGSATTDGGCGMASALGVEFIHKDGSNFIPAGGSLMDIARIDMSKIDKRIKESRFTVMCDVTNPLYGKNGAAYVYGPQKGADHKQVEELDAGLRSYAFVLKQTFDCDCWNQPGSGAAGGLGAGSLAYLNGTLKSGIDTILLLNQFDEKVNDCDVVITGEGRLDEQSLMGKVVNGIVNHSKGKPIIVFCGTTLCTKEELRDYNITAYALSAYSSEAYSLEHADMALELTVDRWLDSI